MCTSGDRLCRCRALVQRQVRYLRHVPARQGGRPDPGELRRAGRRARARLLQRDDHDWPLTMLFTAVTAASAASAAGAARGMTLITAVREVQIPVLSVMLLVGGTAKCIRIIRMGSADAGLGPTALFPLRVRRSLAVLMCGLECGLGIGLILTAGAAGGGAPATSVSLGAGARVWAAVCA